MKIAYTTGEVGKILGISTQAVIRMIDEGELPGFRVPRSRFRRVTYQSLVGWLRAHPEYTHSWAELGLVDDQSAEDPAPAESLVTEGKFYTTGRLATLLDISPRTVSKLIDAGELRGYRIPGPGKDRRVNHASLVEFLGKNPGLAFCLDRLVPAVREGQPVA